MVLCPVGIWVVFRVIMSWSWGELKSELELGTVGVGESLGWGRGWNKF